MLPCLRLNDDLSATFPTSTAFSLLTTVYGQSSRDMAVSVEAQEGFGGILLEGSRGTVTMVAVYAILGTERNSIRGNTGTRAMKVYMVRSAPKMHIKDNLRCNCCVSNDELSADWLIRLKWIVSPASIRVTMEKVIRH